MNRACCLSMRHPGASRNILGTRYCTPENNTGDYHVIITIIIIIIIISMFTISRGTYQGQSFAHQKSTPQKASWIFSGSFQ